MAHVKATNEHLWGRQISSGGQLLMVTASGEVLPPKGQEFTAAAIAQLKKVPGFSVTEEAESTAQEKQEVEESTSAAPVLEDTAKEKKGAKRLVPNKI